MSLWFRLVLLKCWPIQFIATTLGPSAVLRYHSHFQKSFGWRNFRTEFNVASAVTHISWEQSHVCVRACVHHVMCKMRLNHWLSCDISCTAKLTRQHNNKIVANAKPQRQASQSSTRSKQSRSFHSPENKLSPLWIGSLIDIFNFDAHYVPDPHRFPCRVENHKNDNNVPRAHTHCQPPE